MLKVAQAGRDLTLQAQDTVKIRDTATNSFIASAGGKLTVQGNQSVDIFALHHQNSGFFAGGDLVLRSANTVGGDAHYWTGGNFRIEQLDGSLGNLFSPYDPVIRASGDVSFASYTGASLHILAGGSVTIDGLVEINGVDSTNGLTQTVTLSDGTTTLNINGQDSPTLDIRAGTTAFDPTGLIPNPIPGIVPPENFGNEPTSADIKIGSIVNRQGNGRVFLTNQYHPNTSLTGGSIEITSGVLAPLAPELGSYSIVAYSNPVTIDARGNVKIAQGIITGAGSGFTGGDIKILSGGTAELNPGGIDGTSTIRGSLVSQSNGDSGNISVTAVNNITVRGNITSQVVQDDDGNGGNIALISKLGKIDTTGITVSSKSSNGDANTNRGRAGDVTLEAAGDIHSGNIEASSNTNSEQQDFSTISIKSTGGSVELNGVKLSTTNSGSGFAGDIKINALKHISIVNSSSPNTTPENQKRGIFSQGALGNIFIGSDLSPEQVTIDNSELNSQVPNGTGNAGQITINASSIFLTNGSKLVTDNTGSGLAGDIEILASHKDITIRDSQVNSQSQRNKPIDEEVDNSDEYPLILLQAKQGSVFLNQSTLPIVCS